MHRIEDSVLELICDGAHSFKLELSESEEYLEKSRRYARTASQKEKLQVL